MEGGDKKLSLFWRVCRPDTHRCILRKPIRAFPSGGRTRNILRWNVDALGKDRNPAGRPYHLPRKFLRADVLDVIGSIGFLHDLFRLLEQRKRNADLVGGKIAEIEEMVASENSFVRDTGLLEDFAELGMHAGILPLPEGTKRVLVRVARIGGGLAGQRLLRRGGRPALR